MFHSGNDGYGWMMGGGWGLGHWLMFAVMAAAILYPVGLILKRLGFSPFWSVLALVPGINLIALWILALTSSADGNTEMRS
ncbi:hypothetical protein [Rhabdaerophilum sp. SD176]|uniref:hypothetical protein n=1 Tax=Rhabdaerophilum sp. SD176 TaxID=2983548 RepID=UPI0024DFC669|nr:hypothetical protein [Rhabdaerophilum sp. SD176]